MIRKVLISALALVILAVFAVLFYIDSIVESGIETVGSRTLDTTVAVNFVSLSPFSGTGSIGGLNISNPEGFSSPYAFQLGEISTSLNTGSLTSDLIEIDSVIIDSPVITYEINARGDNIRTLLGNIQSREAEDPAAEGAGKELIIREFRMLNPQVELVSAVASAPFTIPDIELNDLGTSGSGGATPREIIQAILTQINRELLNSQMPRLEEYREQARDSLQEIETRARDAIDSATQDLGNSMRDLLNQNQDDDSTPQ